MAKVRLSTTLKTATSTLLRTGAKQCYDEELQFVREATDIFRETGSRHLPEAEATLEELQGLGDKQGYIRPCLY